MIEGTEVCFYYWPCRIWFPEVLNRSVAYICFLLQLEIHCGIYAKSQPCWWSMLLVWQTGLIKCILVLFFFFTSTAKFHIYRCSFVCFLGEWGASSAGTNFMPHIINVNAGEVRTLWYVKKINLILKGNILLIHCYHCQNSKDMCRHSGSIIFLAVCDLWNSGGSFPCSF